MRYKYRSNELRPFYLQIRISTHRISLVFLNNSKLLYLRTQVMPQENPEESFFLVLNVQSQIQEAFQRNCWLWMMSYDDLFFNYISLIDTFCCMCTTKKSHVMFVLLVKKLKVLKLYRKKDINKLTHCLLK